MLAKLNLWQGGVDWHHLITTIACQTQQSVDLSSILQTTVEAVRLRLACDRILIYEFQPEEPGQITIEAVAATDWSLLDQSVQAP